MTTLAAPKLPPDRRRPPVELDETQIPPAAVLAFLIVNWTQEVALFRANELAVLEEGSFEAQRDAHRTVLARLIAQGEELRMAWHRIPDVPVVGFTPEHLVVLLNSLRETDRFEHGPALHPERKAAMLASFDVPEPAH
jgi:hypothetical protein